MHWDDPEGWDGEGGSGWGTHVHQWLIHANVWQKPRQNCKVISLQLKKKSYNLWEGILGLCIYLVPYQLQELQER